MNNEIMAGKYLKGIGIEIGAHQNPIKGIKPIYVDRFKNFAGLKDAISPDFYGDACNLPFFSNSLDYVASSHVIEHVPNPVSAFVEWYRVLRPGGIIYMVVPDKRYTFDHPRDLTTCEHLMSDFENNTTDSDPTHIDDQIDNVDWSMWVPHVPAEQVPSQKELMKSSLHQIVNSGGDINIHFHVFDPSSVIELILILKTYPKTKFNWRILEKVERFPSDERKDGFLVVIKVSKNPRDYLEYFKNKIIKPCPSYPVLPDAKHFD